MTLIREALSQLVTKAQAGVLQPTYSRIVFEEPTSWSRTRDPKNTKQLRWCRLHGKPAKFPLFKCTEVVPS
jgi:hypothetical protein